MQRYEVDHRQAARVGRTALRLLGEMDPLLAADQRAEAQFLSWASRLHEIGISVAHSSYHKHSAYIIENADMPGFSKRDQQRLARIVLAHRGKLERVQAATRAPVDWMLIFALRLAALLHRSRDDGSDLPVMASVTSAGFQLTVNEAWLAASPLTAAALEDEATQWASLGSELRLRRRR
jgi:exopolyphosphatase/guanosine-5'-triphosphate,3'-diphosphate pyrophosphatase